MTDVRDVLVERYRALARWQQAGLWVVVALIAWAILAALLPNGAPMGVVLLGLVLGSLTALTAMGLVLIYRSSRIINFAQGEIGGLAATVAVVMVTGWHLPYFAALPVGLATALGTGWLIDATVVRRFFHAPRLIFTVATIGLLLILGAAEIKIPTLFTKNLQILSTFKTPFNFTFDVHPIVFNGNHLLAVIVVPIVLAGLAWFFTSSDIGVAIRAAADSNERALLLGIPVRRLSRITWVLAAGLSGVASMLSASILGPDLGAVRGPTILLIPLAAAVVARLESFPTTVVASLAIGVFQQVVFWNYPRSSTVDLGVFILIVAALLFQRRRTGRVSDSGLGGYIAVREVRPIPTVLRELREVRFARIGGTVLLGLVALALPPLLTDARIILLTYIVIFGIIAVSLVVLTGWAGQISLGQFAFVGIGAAVTAALLVHARFDLFVDLLLATLAGGVAAVLVGIPALRIPGLLLGVTTMAFAVPVSTWLLNPAYFPVLTPDQVTRPPVLQRFDIEKPLSFYYFCLIGFVIALLLARNFRRSRIGRAVLAVRDNERGAAAYGISPMRAKLAAFAFSGALAGFAGGFFLLGIRKIGFNGFDPVLSFEVFTAAVVGGLGSLPGALLGATYVKLCQYFLHGAAELLATGGGLLFLLMIVPGGLGELMYNLRDRLLRELATRKGLSVPSLAEHPDFEAEGEPDVLQPAGVGASSNGHAADTSADNAVLTVRGVDAGYGQIQVLFDVDAHVDGEEILALLGTNGAGKSTVLRVISGLMKPSKGAVIFNGDDITDLDPVDRVKAGIAMVPGGRGVFGSLTVGENLRMAGWLAREDHEFLQQATDTVYELFPILKERLGEKASSLSGGQQQMLTLAQALLCRPKVLLIDELSLGLAPAVVTQLLDVVKTINARGVAVVVVEQSVNVATALASRAVFMEKGQVRFTGPTAELSGRTDLLRSVFLRHSAPAKAKVKAKAGKAASNGHAADEPRLAVRELGKRFGGVTAVDSVDLTVADGQILGIIGSNGAGKTTLFDLVSGFVPADTGHVALDGRDVTELNAADRAQLGLGRSFQDARLFPSMTVTETLATALERHVDVREPVACIFRVGAVVESERMVDERVDELLELMGLQRYRDAFVSELSTGTRRIVELGCALAHEPSVLLLDEPSSGIAQRESEALAEVLLRVREQTGASLAVIEHDIPLVSSIADEMVCLHLGRVIAQGKPKAVLENDEVVASYLGSDDVSIARSGTATKRKSRSRQRSLAASRTG